MAYPPSFTPPIPSHSIPSLSCLLSLSGPISNNTLFYSRRHFRCTRGRRLPASSTILLFLILFAPEVSLPDPLLSPSHGLLVVLGHWGPPFLRLYFSLTRQVNPLNSSLLLYSSSIDKIKFYKCMKITKRDQRYCKQ